MLEQIKRLKDEQPKVQDFKDKVDKPKNDKELSHFRNHNQSLLAQINKLKNDKKLLEKKFELLPARNHIEVLEKGTNTDSNSVDTSLS